MVMPLAGRVVAAVIGGLLVFTSVSSVIGTLIVSRSVSSRLTRWVDRAVDWGYQLVVARLADSPGDSDERRREAYRERDQLLATQAAAILVTQLAAWLLVAYVGFALLLWPFATRGVVSGLRRRRVLAVHAGLRGTIRGGAGRDRVPGRRDGPGDPHPADRLPADPVRGVQPPGDRGGAAERTGRLPGLGPGAAGPNLLRAGLGHVDPGYDARAVRPMGTLGLRRGREPHHVPAAGAVPLAAAAVVVGDLAAVGPGLGRAVPGAVPHGRAGRPGPAVPAQRVPVLQPDRPGDGLRHPPGAGPGGRDQPHLRRVPRGGGADARGRLPDRT